MQIYQESILPTVVLDAAIAFGRSAVKAKTGLIVDVLADLDVAVMHLAVGRDQGKESGTGDILRFGFGLALSVVLGHVEDWTEREVNGFESCFFYLFMGTATHICLRPQRFACRCT